MLSKGLSPRVRDVARQMAAAPIVCVRRLPVGPLRLGYLATLEQCAAANDCAWCERALTQSREPAPRSMTVLVNDASLAFHFVTQAQEA